MLTAEGCRQRRERFLDLLKPSGPIWLGDPLHLRYLANFHVEAHSLGADFGGLLLLRPDGESTLYHDDRLPGSVVLTHVDERQVVPWYHGQAPARGPRRMALRSVLDAVGTDARIHDALDHPNAPTVHGILADLRRRKDPDEVELLRACMRATEAGHAWARANVRPGMTELEAYAGIAGDCYGMAGQWAVVYGDFVAAGPKRRTGPPTPRVLARGELFIVDFSVVLQGYRSDFTNTIAVGGEPTGEQRRLMDLCVRAMRAGEAELRAGTACLAIYDAVRDTFAAAGMAEAFPHHAGHGLGASHPEAPYIVRESTESLVAGDVVTLEPGLYVEGIGGVRIEHNYLITETGFERLSGHQIGLC